MEKNAVDWIAIILVIVGGLNWGLVGFFKFNLVEVLFGALPVVQRVVYGLVGIAAIYMMYMVSKK